MEKQTFIDILSSMSPQEINDLIKAKGKCKMITPISFLKGGKNHGESKRTSKRN